MPARSTSQSILSPELRRLPSSEAYPVPVVEPVGCLFGRASEDLPESGAESAFSLGLLELVRQSPDAALGAVQELILAVGCDPEVAAEALRWLGHFDDDASHPQRLALLTRCLRAGSARVRDAAALGLSFLGYPAAITALQEAVEMEPSEELRQDLCQVLRDLENGAACR